MTKKKVVKIDTVPKTVIVLCCHRGGSSAVAGVLHYLGVDMGRGNYLGTNSENPLGYFEDGRIVSLNDKILRLCGTSWQATETPDNLWDAAWPKVSRDIKQLRNRHDFWGFKDPRTALTLPLYQKWLNNPHYIVVLREPNAVAQSLSKREGWSEIQALDFAARYYHQIHRVSKDLEPKLIVQYEKLLATPESEIKRIADFVGLSGNVPEDFVDPSLNHYHEKPGVLKPVARTESEDAKKE